MKSLILILLFIGLSYATSQIPDKLKCNNRTYLIRPIRTDFNTRQRYPTNCYRGYVATWKIKNDSLFLHKICTKCCKNKSTKREVALILGKNKIASWYSGLIVIPYYKKIGSTGDYKIYEHLGLKIENGICVNKFSPCVYDDGFEYVNGVYYFNKGSYVKALIHFVYLTGHYPDFFKNDWNYFFILSCLKHLGQDSLSNLYVDTLLSKYPRSAALQYLYAANYLSFKDSDSNKRNELFNMISDTSIRKFITEFNKSANTDTNEYSIEYKKHLKVFFPWIYLPVSHYNSSLELILKGVNTDTECTDLEYDIKFENDNINKLFNDLNDF
jgi:hypothetical protein